MNKIQLENTVQQVNNLYITYRKQFLQQYKTGYVTRKYSITDATIRKHLKEEITIGMKLGVSGLSKAIIFDIDFSGELEKAKDVAEELVEHLSSHYAIPLDKIHTHFSGGKGYHVTIFLDKQIQDKSLKLFYLEVIRNLGYEENEIEFRPTTGQGVKLPLGIHRKTGNYMNYMKYVPVANALIPMSKEESIEYFLQIEPLDAQYFRDYILQDLDITVKQKRVAVFEKKTADDFQRMNEEVNTDGRTRESAIAGLTDILKAGSLIYPDTRHNATYSLLRLLREQGFEIEEAVNQVQEIIANTYDNPETRGFIDKDRKREFVLSEVSRLATYVYKYKDSGVTVRRRDVEVSKEEIIEILNTGNWQHKKLLFSLLLHSKRYADDDGEFFMAYSTMEQYGNTTDRGRALKYLKELEKLDKIKIVSRGKLDTIRTKAFRQPINKPNVYKVKMKSSEIESDEIITITSGMELSLENITYQLLDKKEVQGLLTRRIWESHFRDLYVA